MYLLSTLSFICFVNLAFAQLDLNKIDTITDYKARFYQNGVLCAPNQLCYRDTCLNLNEDIDNIKQIDSSCQIRFRQGNWIEYYNHKWEETDSIHATYIRLSEYDLGNPVGKIYYFNKNQRLVRMNLRFPVLNDSIFNGVQSITYHKNKIEWIQFYRFDEDTTRSLYFNLSQYYSNGKLKSYSFSDDIHFNYLTLCYNRKSLCTKELRLDRTISQSIKRKRNKEIIVTYENGIRYRILRKNGAELRRKIMS